MAEVYLPPSLTALFPQAPRRLSLPAASVAELVDQLEQRHPGMRDRLCEVGPEIRAHLNIFVDGERATLTTALRPEAVVRIIPAVSGG